MGSDGAARLTTSLAIDTMRQRRVNEEQMTELDDALARVQDEGARAQLQAEIDALQRQLRFGLVFERHLPESVRAYGATICVDDTVQFRSDLTGKKEFKVLDVADGTATVQSADEPEQVVDLRELVGVKRFGEAAYPALKSLGSLRRSDERPFHTVINGENYHALQLLRYLYRGQVDCIYIDPPYNTGAKDWKYNNRYVDNKDRWRHSKWLSFMEKRLSIAKELLKADGVLVVTIDEHEVHHLGVLLEQMFPSHNVHTVSIVINPKGTGKFNFSRIAEYALFVVPDMNINTIRGLPPEEADLMTGRRTLDSEDWYEFEEDAFLEDATVLEDDEAAEDLADLTSEEDAGEEDVDDAVIDIEAAISTHPFPEDELPKWELRHARRRGGESSYRHQRPNQFYALYVDRETKRVVRAGSSLNLDETPDFSDVDGLVPVWPIDADGNERVWRFIPSSMQTRIDDNMVVLGRPSSDGLSWTINYWTPRVVRKKYKDVWWNTLHDAGTHGTTLLAKFLGQRNAFPFPKSLYSVRDALLAVVRDRPNALILDFFAGSGTTLHATALINETHTGSRRTILVTNNEVDAKTTRLLRREGHLPGDDEYEKHGIFQLATRPRVEAALTGQRPDGERAQGKYAGGRLFSEGFSENVEFFELTYLDKNDVRQGTEFAEIEPLLWLQAGGIGERGFLDPSSHFGIATKSNYAVLFSRSAYANFLRALEAASGIDHVYLVTDSEDAYRQMTARLPEGTTSSMLYRDYLTNFRINTIEAFR